MSIDKQSGIEECKTCIKGKFTETRSREPREKSKRPLQKVHSDLAGPVSPIGAFGYRYVALFTDDYSGMHFVYFLKEKSQT
jgi:hypothetical protein